MKHGTLSGYKHHRCRCEHCKQANRNWYLKSKGRENDRQGPPLYWPLKSLLQACDTDSVLEVGILTGIPARTLHRAAERGLTDKMADRAAIAIGLHPQTIWPDWFDPYLEGAA